MASQLASEGPMGNLGNDVRAYSLKHQVNPTALRSPANEMAFTLLTAIGVG